eukprot:953672_1
MKSLSIQSVSKDKGSVTHEFVSEPMFVLNMVKNIIGTSILIIPYCMSLMGIPLALVAILVSAVLCWKSFVLLAQATEEVQAESYSGIFRELFGPWAEYSVDISIAILNFVTVVTYVIVARQQLGLVFFDWMDLSSFVDLDGNPITADKADLGNTFTLVVLIVLMCFVLFPTASLPELSSVRFLSIFGNLALAYIVILSIVILCIRKVSYFAAHHWYESSPTSGMSAAYSVLYALPIIGCSLDCHVNAPEFYREFVMHGKGRGMKEFEHAAAWTMGIVGSISALFGVVCYLALGDITEGNVLLEFSATTGALRQAINVARLASGVSVLVSYSLFFNSLRQNLNTIFFRGSPMSSKRRLIMTGVVVLATVVVGFFLENLETVVALTWSVVGSCSVYIFPAVAYMFLTRPKSTEDTLILGFMIGFGFCVTMVFGLITIIWEIAGS